MKIVEVLMAASGSQVSAAGCQSWVNQIGVTSTVLRDPTGSSSATSILNLSTGWVIVANRELEIVFAGTIWDSSSQSKLMEVLAQL